MTAERASVLRALRSWSASCVLSPDDTSSRGRRRREVLRTPRSRAHAYSPRRRRAPRSMTQPRPCSLDGTAALVRKSAGWTLDTLVAIHQSSQGKKRCTPRTRRKSVNRKSAVRHNLQSLGNHGERRAARAPCPESLEFQCLGEEGGGHRPNPPHEQLSTPPDHGRVRPPPLTRSVVTLHTSSAARHAIMVPAD